MSFENFVAKTAVVRSQIAQLLDYSQKWVNTLWKEDVLTILKSTGSFLWAVCEPSNSRLKSINFMKNYGNFKNHNFPENFKICDSIHQFQSQIAWLTDDPLKWACKEHLLSSVICCTYYYWLLTITVQNKKIHLIWKGNVRGTIIFKFRWISRLSECPTRFFRPNRRQNGLSLFQARKLNYQHARYLFIRNLIFSLRLNLNFSFCKS